ncbi:hypothetical protein SPHINGO391_350441 [Sphingomonas aurantiaca]|uniref:Uncharacterized protein n=1 Tax=Sphingomonas aurantiaca TaxID=185949 RepID=A0A5E7Y7J8_9SPHN|nr:hypothetical protein SPHINGO391_350441 [Sphingomonas aurantiaca]
MDRERPRPDDHGGRRHDRDRRPAADRRRVAPPRRAPADRRHAALHLGRVRARADLGDVALPVERDRLLPKHAVPLQTADDPDRGDQHGDLPHDRVSQDRRLGRPAADTACREDRRVQLAHAVAGHRLPRSLDRLFLPARLTLLATFTEQTRCAAGPRRLRISRFGRRARRRENGTKRRYRTSVRTVTRERSASE